MMLTQLSHPTFQLEIGFRSIPPTLIPSPPWCVCMRHLKFAAPAAGEGGRERERDFGRGGNACSRLLHLRECGNLLYSTVQPIFSHGKMSVMKTGFPTNSALLINFRRSSDAEILLLSTDWACKLGPSMQKRVCNVHIFQLSIYFAYHRWWLGV